MYINRPELSLGNNCGYIINQDKIQINIDQIHNHREIGNISGSLSIELWAMPQIYDGKDFSNAYCMSSITIGEIYGEHFLENCQYDLTLTNPPIGVWNLCLMLREYNGGIYETVDYRNFNIPYIVDIKPTLIAETKTKINLNLAKKDEMLQIKGIPEKLINLIISNRPFKSHDDIKKVKGIGQKTLEKILEQCEL